ncbi:hypothetical protein [Azoarcus olearius]|uniref:Uncharacterized protein n=1 Tax=Azoarcus sp. (strain BH72) TaxID=418699 RepID=A1K9Z8_AZOSB|nr:hypothetical protein [Azoarcus olearius]CAL95653.1 conserved hypothetical protein [Azoarcus olearius]
MTDARAVLGHLLGLEEPWAVRGVDLSARIREMVVHVGVEQPRGWFGRARRAPVGHEREMDWRHVNVGDWRVQLKVAVPEGADLSRFGWAGEDELPFTRALTRQIFALFREGVSLEHICKLLNLPLTEVWRYRFALDTGRQGGSGEGEALPATSAAGDSAVPPPEHPVWLALLEGRQEIDVRVLALKLLLGRSRGQFELITDDEVRALKVRELHRYFVRNERALAHELAQLREMA